MIPAPIGTFVGGIVVVVVLMWWFSIIFTELASDIQTNPARTTFDRAPRFDPAVLQAMREELGVYRDTWTGENAETGDFDLDKIDTEGGLHLSEEHLELLVEAAEERHDEKQEIVAEFEYRRDMEAKLLVARPLYFLIGAAVTWAIIHV